MLCLGLCGEKCPNICHDETHNTDKQPFDILFGYEEDQGALFYQLECPGNHVFETNGLDKYFIDQSEVVEREGGFMKFLKCP